MTLKEIPLEQFPNQTVSVTINGNEVTFQVNTFGEGLFFSAFTDGTPVFLSLRLPVNNLLYIKEFEGFLIYTGDDNKYDWTTINNPSILYFLNPSEVA